MYDKLNAVTRQRNGKSVKTRRKRLTDFIPLYSDAKTGAIVIDKPSRDETPATTTAELDKLTGDVPATVLPELKSGDILVNKKGNQYIVHKVSRPKRKTGFQEPIFRLERTIIGNAEWTLDELQHQGMVKI